MDVPIRSIFFRLRPAELAPRSAGHSAFVDIGKHQQTFRAFGFLWRIWLRLFESCTARGPCHQLSGHLKSQDQPSLAQGTRSRVTGEATF